MSWACFKVNDDGRREIYVGGLDADSAQALAGRMRDGMTDKQVGEGWNYEAANEKHGRLKAGTALDLFVK